jgi:hypothetical protein
MHWTYLVTKKMNTPTKQGTKKAVVGFRENKEMNPPRSSALCDGHYPVI